MLKILESQKHGADFLVALEAEPYFRKEVGRRSQGVSSGRGDSKAPCKHPEVEAGLSQVFRTEVHSRHLVNSH